MFVLIADHDRERGTALANAMRAQFPVARFAITNAIADVVAWRDDRSLSAVISERKLVDGDARDMLPMLILRAPPVPLAVFTADGDEAYASALVSEGCRGYFIRRDDAMQSLNAWLARYIPGQPAITPPQPFHRPLHTEIRRYRVTLDPDNRVCSVERTQSADESAARLRIALEEKDALLREVHHRVKNNLQIISSMLSLQLRGLEHPGTRHVLEDNQRRIQAMALVHEHLYTSSDLSKLSAQRYFGQLVQGMLVQNAPHASTVTADVTCTQETLGADEAIYLGLIVTELVGNSIRHAFPSGRKGRVLVRFNPAPHREAGFELIVQDDGVGLPARVDPSTTPTLGLRVVANLARQLHAELVISRDAGTTFRIHTTRTKPT